MSRGKIFNWADVESWPSDDRYPGIAVKVVDGKDMQLVWAEFQPGSTYPLHAHESGTVQLHGERPDACSPSGMK